MSQTISRRRALTGGAIAATSIAMPRIARAQAAFMSLRCGTATPGFTVVFFDYVRDNKLDEKYGFQLGCADARHQYIDPPQRIRSRSLDITTSVFDNWAERHLAGVPVKLICGLTTADQIGIIVPGDGAKTLADLRGKTIAAPMASGIYRMTRALVREVTGIDLETEATMQNAENPAQGVTLVLANRADAAVAWEPMISAAMTRKPDLGSLRSMGSSIARNSSRSANVCLGAQRQLSGAAEATSANGCWQCTRVHSRHREEFCCGRHALCGRMRIEAKVSKLRRRRPAACGSIMCRVRKSRGAPVQGAFELLVRNKVCRGCRMTVYSSMRDIFDAVGCARLRSSKEAGRR